MNLWDIAAANPVLLSVGSSLLGGGLLWAIQGATRSLRERSGEYSGTWIDQILDDDGRVVKSDEIKMKQRGKEIFGKIHRIVPENQNHRHYKFRGYVRGESILAIFWSTDESIRSFGSWHVKHVRDYVYEGFYLSLANDRGIEKIPIRLKRIES